VTSVTLDDVQKQGTADLRLTGRLFSYVWRERRLFLTALVLYPIDALSVVVPPYLVQQMLDVAIPRGDARLLWMLGGAYGLALALEYVSGFASQMSMGVLGQRAMLRLRSDLFAHVQRLPASFYDKNPIGRVLTRLTNDVEALNDVFATGAISVLADLVTIAAVVGTMLWLNVELTLFSFMVVPPLIIVAVIFQRIARQAFRRIRSSLARINTFLAEHISGMAVVQVFGQERRTQDEFAALNTEYRDANRNAVLADAWLYSIVEAIGIAAVAALLWYGAHDMATGAIGAGTLVAFMAYIRRFFVPIRDLSTKYTVLQSGFTAGERIFQLLDTPLEITSAQGAKPVSTIERGIGLRGVWFRYREDHDHVLQGLSLDIEKGEHVALVGATGSGKTTVLKLLNRSYDVERGVVSVDGVDVRQLDLGDLRRLFAVVLQDVYLFSGTIIDNLTITGRVSREDAMRAARAVGADTLISRLSKGYDTQVNEAGANFSAGERQLLAFARALALGPQALILDEATSNIDSETESRIQEGLAVLMKGRTAVIVAHRLSTIRKVDRIVVLHQGQVVEQGSHDFLMRHGGSYAKLVELQLAK
jgi:ATP-binding cassette, subfamily B, multidrug efflux pump